MTGYIRLQNDPRSVRVDGQHRRVFGRPLEPSRPGGDPQGIFAGWDWDGRRLEVKNDRYGICPLFFSQGEHDLIVSNSLTKVVELGASRELDMDALAVFLRCQVFLGEDTPFRQIKQLPPGSTLVWSEGRVDLQSRRPAPAPVTLSRGETVDAYIALFRQAIQRRLPREDGQEIVLPLSGGQDSRHILLELLAQGRPPGRCVTVSRAWSPKLMDDVRLATEVARTAQVPHEILMRDDPIFELESRKNVLTNFCTNDHAWFLTLIDHADLSRALVFDGIAGDILSACQLLHEPLLNLYKEGQFTRLAEHFLGPETVYPRVLSPAFYAQANRDRAVRRLAAEIERHANAQNPLTEFIFWNRTRRSIGPAPYAILDRFTTVDAPYLDPDLFDFLIARPPEFLDPDFHKRTIRAAYPRFADIPFSELSAPIADRAEPFIQYARHVARSLLRSPVGSIPMLRKRYVLPRLSRCLLDSKYALVSSWLPQLIVYLSQLNALAVHGSTPQLSAAPGDLKDFHEVDRGDHAMIPRMHGLPRLTG